jgi:hypothetical protein
MTSYKELVWLHTHSYGKATRIRKQIPQGINILLAVVIPLAYPIPVALWLNRKFKDFIYRYD